MRRSLLLVLLTLLPGCASPNASRPDVTESPSTRGADASAPNSSDSTRLPLKIAEFQGDYRFLSNFWPAHVEFDGITYPTAEHAYQAAKTLDPAERRRIAALPTPAEAKREGRALPLRPDWEQVKLDVMERCVRYKFSHDADLRARLLATGDAQLEEGNAWGDRFWGVYEGQGENWLGRILMTVRQELK